MSTDITYMREFFEEQNKILKRINNQLTQIIVLLKKGTESEEEDEEP